MSRDFRRAAVFGWIIPCAAALSIAAWASGTCSAFVCPVRSSVLIRDLTPAFASRRLADVRRCLSPDLVRFAMMEPPAAALVARRSRGILACHHGRDKR